MERIRSSEDHLMRSSICLIGVQERTEKKRRKARHKDAKTSPKQNKSLQPERTHKLSTMSVGSWYQVHPSGFSEPWDREQASKEEQSQATEKETGVVSDISTATMDAR